jgi:hypothetical protein
LIGCAAALAIGAGMACARPTASIAPFSAGVAGGDPPAPWRRVAIPRVSSPTFELASDAGRTVLRVHSAAAAGSLAHDLAADPAATPRLSWHWKVERALARAAWGRKDGDDFAARVYVTFDVPPESLPITDRAKLAIGRAIYGDDLPSAALCYVWAAREPAGTAAWNPYTDRVRMVVLQSGNARAGQWVAEARDLEEDFRAAFGAQWSGPTPRITGVLLSSDTDQTGESVTAWFGDLRLGARR